MDAAVPLSVTAVGYLLAAWAIFRVPDPRIRRAGTAMLLGFVLQASLVNLLKGWVSRPRPLLDPSMAAEFAIPDGLADFRSFPSGHVASATALALGFWLMVGKGAWRHALLLYPPAMALARVLGRAHWPSDTLAGMAIGAVALGVAWWGCGLAPTQDALRRNQPLRVGLAALIVFSLLGLFPTDGAVDPVSDDAVAGLSLVPHGLRLAFEPWVGPALALGAVPFASSPSAIAAAGALVLLMVWNLRRMRTALLLFSGSVALVAVLILTGWVPNDRLQTSRAGAVVDFHLHGGDPCDGGRSLALIRFHQETRGVDWSLLSWHDAVAPMRLNPATDLVATEWSGGHPKRTTPHVLILGSREAVEAGLSEKDDPLEAVRKARALGAYCIVAHAWRTQQSVPMPSVAAWKQAGVEGFEVGNRYQDLPGPAAHSLDELDRDVRALGLTRWSFSDDHGIPPGSSCVTFVEGIPKTIPATARDALLALRAIPVDHVRPLLLVPTNGPAPLLPLTALGDYLVRMRTSSRLAWVLWVMVFALVLQRRTPRS